VNIKSHRWHDWLFAIAILICIKVLVHFGVDKYDIYRVIFFCGISIFITGLLYFLIRFKLSEKRLKKSNTRVGEGLKKLERITKE